MTADAHSRARHPDPLVAAVVVTHNSAAVVETLLDSLPSAMDGLPYRVVVVDNGSTDDTVGRVRQRSDCHLVVQSNRGYAAGINAGVAAAPEAGRILVLNPDVVLMPGSVRHLAAALDQHAVAIVVPKVLTPDGTTYRSLRREPTLARALGLTRTGIPALSEYVSEAAAYEMAHAVDWALGAVMLIGRGAHEELGGWDESFFRPATGRGDRPLPARARPRTAHLVRAASPRRAHRRWFGSVRGDARRADPEPGQALPAPSTGCSRRPPTSRWRLRVKRPGSCGGAHGRGRPCRCWSGARPGRPSPGLRAPGCPHDRRGARRCPGSSGRPQGSADAPAPPSSARDRQGPVRRTRGGSPSGGARAGAPAVAPSHPAVLRVLHGAPPRTGPDAALPEPGDPDAGGLRRTARAGAGAAAAVARARRRRGGRGRLRRHLDHGRCPGRAQR